MAKETTLEERFDEKLNMLHGPGKEAIFKFIKQEITDERRWWYNHEVELKNNDKELEDHLKESRERLLLLVDQDLY